MNAFPRTTVGDLSVSRMVIGTNWFLGYSHCTRAKDAYIQEHVADRKRIADIIETFARAGVDTIIGLISVPVLAEAIREAEDRTGREIIVISTPHFTVTKRTPFDGFDRDEVERVLDSEAKLGTSICLPHSCVVDQMVDRATREIRQMAPLVKAIRDRGMSPGLSTHMPESIIYADETDLDVDTYISIFNAMGFLMSIEVDWVASIIHNARKPVLTIKPMAAGQIRPLQGLTFSWNAIRDQDMVAVGAMSPAEAQELVDLSLRILEHRHPDVALQETRSKSAVKGS